MIFEILFYLALAILVVYLIAYAIASSRLRPSTIQIDHDARVKDIHRLAGSLRGRLRENAVYVATLRDTADRVEEAGAIAVLDLTSELPHVPAGKTEEEHRVA